MPLTINVQPELRAWLQLEADQASRTVEEQAVFVLEAWWVAKRRLAVDTPLDETELQGEVSDSVGSL